METAEEEKTLRKLEAQLGKSVAERRQIEGQIREQRKRIAMKKGEIVRYKKDLQCKRHPNAKFVRTHKIGTGLGNDSFWYACKECMKEVKAGKTKPGQISTAYSCPHCGFVKGSYVSRPYESSPESWRALAGRKGTHFHCRICGSMIGSDYYMVS